MCKGDIYVFGGSIFVHQLLSDMQRWYIRFFGEIIWE
ncbi:hypothetical protein [Eubacterium sp.]